MRASVGAVATLALLAQLAACPIGRVPSHLAPPVPDSPDRGPSSLADLDALVRAMVGRDPLGRSASNVSASAAEALDGGEAYARLIRVASQLEPGGDDALRQLRDLEATHRGTPIVPLSRGVRVREIEGVVGTQTRLTGPDETRVLYLLTPLSSTADDTRLPTRPLQWLVPGDAVREPVLVAADRWALLGWMDGPGMDLQPVADALGAPPYDHLRGTPAARLVLARTSGGQGDVEPGLSDLERATVALLEQAVADRTRAQERSAATWKAISEELGSDTPRDALLVRAEERLRDVAGIDLAAGGALLALQARRVWGRCPETPCVGLDRVDGLGAAGRWHPRLARLADLLQIAALHDAIDGIEVAQGTVRYPQAAVHLVDALIGTGAVPPQALVIRQRSPDASTWLSLGRSVGTEQATTWDEARNALRGWAAGRARDALVDEPDPRVRQALAAVIAAADSKTPGP